MTQDKTLTQADLRQFIGSENWYRHGLVRSVLFTDGAKFLADHAGAYWLLDAIALAQKGIPRVAAATFQLWKLTVHPDNSAVLCCEDGDCREVYRQEIPFTDFPLPEIKLYCTDNTILLPIEY